MKRRPIAWLLSLGLAVLWMGGAVRTAQGEEFTVTAATLAADPKNYRGPGPAVIRFEGTITATGAGRVKYRIVRSDGADGGVKTLTFSAAGSLGVATEWHLGGSRSRKRWQRIEVIEPVMMSSNKAWFSTGPEGEPPLTDEEFEPPPAPDGFRVTAVTLRADPAQFDGDPPRSFRFLGTITTNGPGQVKYRFARSDGAGGPEPTVEFSAAGAKEVESTWMLGGAGVSHDVWQRLEILSPNEIRSEPAHVHVRFRKPGESGPEAAGGPLPAERPVEGVTPLGAPGEDEGVGAGEASAAGEGLSPIVVFVAGMGVWVVLLIVLRLRRSAK